MTLLLKQKINFLEIFSFGGFFLGGFFPWGLFSPAALFLGAFFWGLFSLGAFFGTPSNPHSSHAIMPPMYCYANPNLHNIEKWDSNLSFFLRSRRRKYFYSCPSRSPSGSKLLLGMEHGQYYFFQLNFLNFGIYRILTIWDLYKSTLKI